MALFNSGNSLLDIMSNCRHSKKEDETFRGVFRRYYAVIYTPTSSKHVDSYQS